MTFEERYPVIKGSWLDRNLVFHIREENFTRWLNAAGEVQSVFSDDVVRWEVRTRCGFLLSWWTRDDPGTHGHYVTLRHDFAAAIARPCRRCYVVIDE